MRLTNDNSAQEIGLAHLPCSSLPTKKIPTLHGLHFVKPGFHFAKPLLYSLNNADTA